MSVSVANPDIGGHEGECQRLPYYSQRNRNLDWRSNWFGLSRSKDQAKLIRYRDLAFDRKLTLIKRYGRRSGKQAGYDPAGAGSPWYSVGPRNVNGRVKSLAIHPTDPQIIYAGTAAGGVWKSVNGGQSWDSLWDMQESLAIGAIAVSTSSPDTIYAGTGEWTPGWSGNYGGAGVYVSTDAGLTWSKRPAVQSRYIGKLVVDPTNEQRLWVCGNQGLERSDDGGLTWTNLRRSTITDIVLDPMNANTVFIAIRYDGFYKSTDSGDSFSLLAGSPTGATVDFPKMAIGESGTHENNFIVIKMAAVIQSSVDGGTTFNVVPGTHGGSYPGWCDAVAVAPDDEDIMFWGGVALDRTADGGSTWTSLPVHADQHVAVFAPSNSNMVYFANDGGVYRSSDKGASVEKVSNGLVITQFYNINFWSMLSNVLGGGAQDNGVSLTTSGLSWSPIFGGDGGWILFDPTDPRTIYTESQNANIVKSTDGGRTWVGKTDGLVGPKPWEGVLHMDPNDHLRIFYGTDRVLRSTDGIATAWTESSQVLSGTVTAIWTAPSDSSRIYAGTMAGGVYRSDDGGDTKPWADKSGSLPRRAVTSISTTADADTVLVSLGGLSGAASSQSVYRSTDGGDNWTDVSGDLPNVVGNSAVSDPSDPNILYLATDTGVFRTTNLGANWLAFDNGIPNVPCTGLVVDVASQILYCGTFGRGAYKLDISPGVTKASVDVYFRDNDLDSGEIFPSPSGLPNPLLPAPATANFWTSPDIKINHDPFFTKSGVFDGVDFDTALVHQDAYRGQTNRFYVQVQNRGWQSTSNLSVRAFLADASAGLPDLPNALTAPDFNLANTTRWTPVGPAQTIATLRPNRPVILTWDFAVPVNEATHSCCLVVMSCPDDPFTNAATNIAQLVTQDKHVTLKNLHVVDPGPGGMPHSKQAIDFHNVSRANRSRLDILIRASGFGGGRIGLLLPKIRFMDDDEKKEGAGRGVTTVPLCDDDPLGKWYLRAPRNNKIPKDAMAKLERRFENCDRSRIFDFDPTTISTLGGIEIGPGETLRAILVARIRDDVYITGPARLEIWQVVDGELVGGSTFQFGYNLPAAGTVLPCRRVRITAEALEFERGRHRDGCDGGKGHGRGHDDWNCEGGGKRATLIAKVVLNDDPERVSYRSLDRGRNDEEGKEHEEEDQQKKPQPQHQTLFNAHLQEGDSLTLSILSSTSIPPKKPREKESYLYTRRFDGANGIRSWLGRYEDPGIGGLKRVSFRVDEVGGSGGRVRRSD